MFRSFSVLWFAGWGRLVFLVWRAKCETRRSQLGVWMPALSQNRPKTRRFGRWGRRPRNKTCGRRWTLGRDPGLWTQPHSPLGPWNPSIQSRELVDVAIARELCRLLIDVESKKRAKRKQDVSGKMAPNRSTQSAMHVCTPSARPLGYDPLGRVACIKLWWKPQRARAIKTCGGAQ